MRRRDKTGDKAAKSATPQDVEAPQCVKGRSSPKPFAAGANEKIALLTRERDEALEQLTATSEVLQVISSSPTDLQSILKTPLACVMQTML